jgi:hypothetical protein
MPPPPRLFGIPARDAPVVAVLRRGPTDWCRIGRWDVGPSPTYQPGAWVRARLYPQRCDLSPDGRWLCYFTLRARADWDAGPTYVAVSRLPWATALAAWDSCGTWTRGMHFVEADGHVAGPPAEGDTGPLGVQVGLAFTRPAAFAVERRRGWTETADSPVRGEHDMWDERRADRVTMQKRRPGGGPTLLVSGRYAAFRELDTDRYGEPAYRLDDEQLPGVHWADWSPDGRLLVATADGRLQVRDGGSVRWEADLSDEVPDPQPPPADAARW